MAALAILLSITLGFLLFWRFGGFDGVAPRWAGWLLVFGCGAAIGMGASGSLFFVLLFAGFERATVWIVLAGCAVLGYEIWRKPKAEPPKNGPRFSYVPLLWIAAAVAFAIVTYAMSAAWESNPQGNWDAFSIWNLRAKFLAAGDGLYARAWSPLLSATHPEYPLLLSSFIAACWSAAGAVSDFAPIATSYLFFAALVSIVAGGITALRGPLSGALAAICLIAIPALLTEAPAQYADLPLACFMAGAVLLALLDRPALAGAMAGMAAWTKDEGLLFLAIGVLAVAIQKRHALVRFCSGAAPAAVLALIFKFAIARGTHTAVGLAHSSLASKLTDANRYAITASAMLRELLHWNAGWYHPVLPIAVLALALRFDRRHAREALFCLAIAACMVGGYFGVYIITPYALEWQLQSSLTRLFVQLCPIVLAGIVLALRAPEGALVFEPAAPKPESRRKSKR